jgi:hypothetical protein
VWHSEARQQDRLLLIRRRCVEQFAHEISKTLSEDIGLMLSWSILLAVEHILKRDFCVREPLLLTIHEQAVGDFELEPVRKRIVTMFQSCTVNLAIERKVGSFLVVRSKTPFAPS